MEKYYYPTRGQEPDIECIQHCYIKECRIGSVVCQECENCEETGGSDGFAPEWIKCRFIEEAKG